MYIQQITRFSTCYRTFCFSRQVVISEIFRFRQTNSVKTLRTGAGHLHLVWPASVAQFAGPLGIPPEPDVMAGFAFHVHLQKRCLGTSLMCPTMIPGSVGSEVLQFYRCTPKASQLLKLGRSRVNLRLWLDLWLGSMLLYRRDTTIFPNKHWNVSTANSCGVQECLAPKDRFLMVSVHTSFCQRWYTQTFDVKW